MLFKILHGDKSRISTDITPYHEGYCYVTHDGDFYVDMNDERVKLNAKDAETLLGASLNTILNSSDLEIPTSKAVLDAINEVNEKAGIQADWTVNGETSPAYIKNRPFYESDPIVTTLIENQTVSFTNEFANIYMAQVSSESEFYQNATYKITWDDMVYDLQGQESNGSFSIGDMSIIKGASADGQPPFLIVPAEGGMITICTLNTSSSHTISIECSQTYITTLPSKFLSDDVFTLDNFLNVNYTAGKVVEAEYGTGEIFNDYVNNKATGCNSHAEGYATEATNYNAHAEGSETIASGHTSHAEGSTTTASGQASHAEGYKTKATGWNSHAEGQDTEAVGRSQHVQGEYNIVDKSSEVSQRGKYVHIVGNGNSANARSNAHTLDWSGNAWFQSNVYVGGTSQDDAQMLATQAYVDALIAALRPKHATVSLPATGWIGNASPYYQVVDIAGVTEYSQIDLKPSAEQLEFFRDKDIAFVTENEDGVVTVYVLGDKPANDYTMQVTITEVTV